MMAMGRMRGGSCYGVGVVWVVGGWARCAGKFKSVTVRGDANCK